MSKNKLFPFLYILFFIFYILVIFYHTNLIDGNASTSLDDDPMVSMRYAKNLAMHGDLSWNKGDRVEGFTNPLLQQ